MSAPVFLAEAGTLVGYAPGDVYVLDGDEGRHAGVVQRRGPGERIDVVDGAGVRLRCEVRTVGAGTVSLAVLERAVEAEPRVRLGIVQALAKGDRDELAIEAATELGVDEVVPWQAHRSVVVWRGERVAKNHWRWQATVRAAAKQSRRARVPDVAQAHDTAALARLVGAAVAGGGAVVVLHEEAETPLAAIALPDGGGTGPEAPRVLVVVGPEGGIADAEIELLVAAGARTARLGPHVLRTSTAGPAALAVLAQRLGRWE